ncbi:MAG: queuosine precursor transporter [Cetobacterium sp.]
MNEFLLIMSLVCFYSMVLILYKFLGKIGIFVWVAIASIMANIEVGVLIDAFGMKQTLGNVLFATTFLASDILSENHGKKTANMSVTIGILANLIFVVITKFYYQFQSDEHYLELLKEAFNTTPRFMVAGAIVYVVAQYLDVFLYHFIWDKTSKKFGYEKSSFKGLWIRNNLSTLFSQFVNSFLFTFLAFGNVLGYKELISMAISSYFIFVATSLLDTPILYFCKNNKVVENE